MKSEVKRFLRKLLMFLSNHPERTLRNVFVDFANEDMEVEEEVFMRMFEMYE